MPAMRKQQLPSARKENNIFIFSLLLNGNFREYVFIGGAGGLANLTLPTKGCNHGSRMPFEKSDFIFMKVKRFCSVCVCASVCVISQHFTVVFFCYLKHCK